MHTPKLEIDDIVQGLHDACDVYTGVALTRLTRMDNIILYSPCSFLLRKYVNISNGKQQHRSKKRPLPK